MDFGFRLDSKFKVFNRYFPQVEGMAYGEPKSTQSQAKKLKTERLQTQFLIENKLLGTSIFQKIACGADSYQK